MLVPTRFVILTFLIAGCQAISPLEFAKRATEKILKSQEIFFEWDYGGAIILDALHDFNKTFDLNYLDTIDSLLTKFLTDPHSNPYGYKLANDQAIPFDKAVGDGIGLFPINYLTRAYGNEDKSKGLLDLKVVDRVLTDYIIAWPLRLADGTFSRHAGWKGEIDNNASFLWGDDQFMGLTLLSRVAKKLHYSPFAEYAAKQAIQFASHMMDPNDGLFYHGYNDADQKTSCCKWGRANGWGMLSHVEVIDALEYTQANSSLTKKMISILKKHTNGLLKCQSQDGRWHQVLTANSTFLETSATAMFLSSIARAVMKNWIPFSASMDKSIQMAWKGLQETLQADGSISGICMGTGIQTGVEDYNKRPTVYELSGPGLGSVLYAIRDYYLYSQINI